MAVEKSLLENTLRDGFPDSNIVVVDLVGDNNHYQVTIESDLFKGKTRIAQHQMVYASIRELIKEDLHALSIITKNKDLK